MNPHQRRGKLPQLRATLFANRGAPLSGAYPRPIKGIFVAMMVMN